MRTHKFLFAVILFFYLLTSACRKPVSKKVDNREETIELLTKAKESGKPALIFEESKYDFGSIDADKLDSAYIVTDFIFINKNDQPIIITKADVSCGCVYPSIPNKPILTGEKGIVSVKLDVNQLNGHFSKSIYIKSNAENDVELLRVTGNIKK